MSNAWTMDKSKSPMIVSSKLKFKDCLFNCHLTFWCSLSQLQCGYLSLEHLVWCVTCTLTMVTVTYFTCFREVFEEVFSDITSSSPVVRFLQTKYWNLSTRLRYFTLHYNTTQPRSLVILILTAQRHFV